MLKAKPSFHIFLNTESRSEKQHETNTENVFFRKTLTTHIHGLARFRIKMNVLPLSQ